MPRPMPFWIGWPIIAKTSRGGYDGKGVWKVDAASEAGVPFSELRPDLVIVAEEYIPFVRELSALVVRGTDGLARAYPISETVQRDSICHETTTPAPGLPNEVADRLARHALLIADVRQHIDRERVVGRFGELHVQLDRLVFRGDHEPDRADQLLVGQFAVLLHPRKWTSKLRHT